MPSIILYPPPGALAPDYAAAVSRASAAGYTDERIFVPVLEGQAPWWQGALSTLPSENVIVQPFDRGSGMSVLLASIHVFRRNPRCDVVIAPLLAANIPRESPRTQGPWVVVRSCHGPAILASSGTVLHRLHDAQGPVVATMLQAIGDDDDLHRVYLGLPWLDLANLFASAPVSATA